MHIHCVGKSCPCFAIRLCLSPVVVTTHAMFVVIHRPRNAIWLHQHTTDTLHVHMMHTVHVLILLLLCSFPQVAIGALGRALLMSRLRPFGQSCWGCMSLTWLRATSRRSTTRPWSTRQPTQSYATPGGGGGTEGSSRLLESSLTHDSSKYDEGGLTLEWITPIV